MPGGHDVLVIHDLEEGNDLGLFNNLLLPHLSGDLFRVAIHASHQAVSIRSLLVP